LYDRSNALLQLISPLGTDVLVPVSFSGDEGIGQPYSYRIGMVSQTSGISPDRMLHQQGCLILRRNQHVARYFAGIFQQFKPDGTPRLGMSAYSALLVPKFWFLNQTMDCRIWQNLSVVDILQTMFNDAGLAQVEFRIYGDRSPLPYVTQYNETDFQFATRLMEESGYFYFFEHAESGETLVVADANTAFQDIPDATLRFDSADEAEDVLSDWNRPGATTWGTITLKDYDPTAPTNPLDYTAQPISPAPGAQSRDIFRWPAVSFANQVVTDRADIMAKAADAEISQSSSSSIFRGLIAGGRFQLANDPLGGDGAYIIRSLTMDAIDESWTTSGASSDYRSQFVCFPDKVAWHHPIATPRPRMAGVYSAVVLGPQGEEIYTDDLGRVKVRFKWDWRNQADAAQAVWARVVQPWAGGQFGGQFVPRVGMEVAVAFVDADPDRPIVLGGLYNGDQTPIYSVADKTKTGFRTRSTPGGSASQFNEFTFDDNAGQEQVYLKSQKDLTTQVLHDATHTVGNNRSRTVTAAETVNIGSSQSLTIGKGRTTEISQNDDTLTVQQGNLSITVSQGEVTIAAMQSITLQVGGSWIRIDQSGVTVSAMTVSVQGEMSVGVSAAMVSIAGDACTEISGGIVNIN
jgi:type VI secretion system secreted protein VgrG